MREWSVGIVGGSGYAGGELLRLLLGHSGVGDIQVTSQRYVGRRVGTVHPNLRGLTELKFCDLDALQSCDLIFMALPHGQSRQQVDRLEKLAPILIDLGGDFRLAEPQTWVHNHGVDHAETRNRNTFVYGLPELHRDRIRQSARISSAGCNATATILALAPLYRRGLVDITRTVVEVKAGTSQAGNAPTPGSHHPDRSGALRCYKPVGHRHVAEIKQELGLTHLDPLHFSATSVDMVRGVQAVCHVFLHDEDLTERDIWAVYRQDYGGEHFVRLINEKRGPHRLPDPRPLAGTNFCDIGFVRDPDSNRLVVISALDNLGKGAAGQALQAFNIVSGHPETRGLEFTGLYPL